jgi:hypothetical protein
MYGKLHEYACKCESCITHIQAHLHPTISHSLQVEVKDGAVLFVAEKSIMGTLQ